MERLGPLGQFVQLLARIACRSGRRKRKNISFDLQLLFCLRWKTARHFVQFHPEAQVRLVAAVFSNDILVLHMRERRFRLDPSNGAGAHHHLLDHMKNVFLPRKRHFQVELREFQLAVGALIFIAEALHDLEVFVHSRDHQDLLENLGRLR